jgi:NTE family protein
MAPRTRLHPLVSALALLLAGCAHYPANSPLPGNAPAGGYRFQPVPGGDGLSCFLFFSGGGTRAAALSYGVLGELRETHPRALPPGRSLLGDVNLISAVSGGSLTAAYYCLYGDRIFQDFESRFLKRNVERDLILESLSPANWFRLGSSNFGRSDLAAEFYDRNLFGGATYADLMRRPGGPYLLINATDIGTGIRFGFTQDQFDLIYSDLSRFPLSRAVAASSAVPLLLSPVTLRNYSGIAGRVEPSWLPPAGGPGGPDALPSDYGSLLRSYLDGKNRPFIHLVDGGFSDDLGLRGFLEVSVVTGGLENMADFLQARHVRRLVFIVVDATVDHAAGWSRQEATPSTFSTLGALGDSVARHDNTASIDVIRQKMTALRRASVEKARTAAGIPSIPDEGPGTEPFGFYFVTLGLDDVKDPREREFLKTVPSNLDLPSSTVDRITAAGRLLLRQSPEFQRLLRDLAAEAP